MAPHRQDRIAEEMRKELSDIIQYEMKDPRVKGLVSVTHVAVSRDISSATVYVSSLGDEQEQLEMLKAIKQAAGFIRGELANRLRLRFIPELNFKGDNSIQAGARINALLNQEMDAIKDKETEAELQDKQGEDA